MWRQGLTEVLVDQESDLINQIGLQTYGRQKMKMNSKRLLQLSVGSIHHALQIYILLQLLPSWPNPNPNPQTGKGLRCTDISLP